MEVAFGTAADLGAWMQLVRAVSGGFPGLETAERLAEHEQTVLRFMQKRQALCVRAGGAVAGVLLFSRSRNMICCLAVAPAFRRRGIATALLKAAIGELDGHKPVTVSTFRAGDEKGTAPRSLYHAFGFTAGALTEEFGYPNQVFVLAPKA